MMSACASAHSPAMSSIESMPPAPIQRWTLYVITRRGTSIAAFFRMANNQNNGDRMGEGNPDAARRYDQGVEKTIREGKVDELAEKAKKALESPEGDELRRAEERGKKG